MSAQEQDPSEKRFRARRAGAAWFCSCPAFKKHPGSAKERTCRHVREARRAAGEPPAGAPPKPSPPPKAAAPPKPSPAPPPPHLATASLADLLEPIRPLPWGAGAAPPLLLAHTFEPERDPTGWWMSEKLDGIRAYWDGRCFWSRLGNAFKAPDFFTADLPEVPVDGELWGGRGRFQETTSIVRRPDQPERWRALCFLAFDLPTLDHQPFEARDAHLRALLAAAKPQRARAVEHVRCEGRPHLEAELRRLEQLGGEGLMLRKPGSLYEPKRSLTLLKVKRFKDGEAVVVGHVPGTGKYEGLLGALRVQLPNGITFSVGTGLSDAERAAPPPPGTLITYRYQELSRDGVPRFPSFVRVRSGGL